MDLCVLSGQVKGRILCMYLSTLYVRGAIASKTARSSLALGRILGFYRYVIVPWFLVSEKDLTNLEIWTRQVGPDLTNWEALFRQVEEIMVFKLTWRSNGRVLIMSSELIK